MYLTNDSRALAAVEAWNTHARKADKAEHLFSHPKAELAVQKLHRGPGTSPVLIRIAKAQGNMSASASVSAVDGRVAPARKPKPAGSQAASARTGPRAAKRSRSPGPAPGPLPAATSLSQPLLTGDRNALGETVCHRCKSNLDEGDILLCDGCELEFHRKCLRVPLSVVPATDWLCEACLTAAVGRRGALIVQLFEGRRTVGADRPDMRRGVVF